MILIAELCQNHNGDFELLKEMIYAAKESGADYVKIQSIFANMLSYRERFEEGLIINGKQIHIKRPYKEEYNRLKKLELSFLRQAEFVSICNQINIKPLTTSFNILSIPQIVKAGFKDIKIASYDCGSGQLIRQLKPHFNKIFLSTGASSDDEIKNAARLLYNSNYYMLHCVTLYPTPLKEYHLSRMDYLKQYTKQVGWSDHSLVERDGIKGSIAAIYFGAKVLERHFTILQSKRTKDGPVSISPKQLKEIRKFSKLSNKDQQEYLDNVYPRYMETLGNENRKLSNEELLNRDYYRGRFANIAENGEIFYNWEKNKN
tara:strand:- start:3926 stop:4876 length:951 start_codon:yes stop_codon:yes gene_type:complete